MLSMNPCNLCPRACGIDRSIEKGFCGCGDTVKIARAALHYWEEPCLSGTRGSGTVFFSGCGLQCCYCQNYDISFDSFGEEVSVARLAEIFLELQEQGAHNINLVTATQYVPRVMEALKKAKPRLAIPVVYNSSGYERVEAVKALKGYVDIWMPDIKYMSSELSQKYSQAADYFKNASEAVREMVAQTGPLVFDKDGILQKGVMIRHLVLPGARRDSIAILNWMHDTLPENGFLLSLMSQYTPAYKAQEHRELNRRVTTLEYESVVAEAVRLGLTAGYMQGLSSAGREYTPPFDLNGVKQPYRRKSK